MSLGGLLSGSLGLRALCALSYSIGEASGLSMRLLKMEDRAGLICSGVTDSGTPLTDIVSSSPVVQVSDLPIHVDHVLRVCGCDFVQPKQCSVPPFPCSFI